MVTAGCITVHLYQFEWESGKHIMVGMV